MNKNSEYEKMPKNLKGLDLDEKAFSNLGKLKWVVTEKVHGANFSFVYEGRKLLFAKRKDYLKWTDDFFGFQTVVNDIEDRIIRLFEQLQIDITADRFIIYGELFGGKYPHPEVPAKPDVQAIQTGVYYCPDVKFCAFDIAIEIDENDVRYFLDYSAAIQYFEQFGIFYAKPLFTGKLNEALNFDTRINSKIPLQLGLPELDSNLIEGVVVKPMSHLDLDELEFRPIIKLKNPEFDEEKKFHEAEKWSFVPNISSQSEELGFLVDEMNNYVTENRLNSAISKIGQLDFSNEQRVNDIQQEFVQDILTDFNNDNDKIMDELGETQVSWIKNRLEATIILFMNSFRQ